MNFSKIAVEWAKIALSIKNQRYGDRPWRSIPKEEREQMCQEAISSWHQKAA